MHDSKEDPYSLDVFRPMNLAMSNTLVMRGLIDSSVWRLPLILDVIFGYPILLTTMASLFILLYEIKVCYFTSKKCSEKKWPRKLYDLITFSTTFSKAFLSPEIPSHGPLA